jgi:hypothetical protein
MALFARISLASMPGLFTTRLSWHDLRVVWHPSTGTKTCPKRISVRDEIYRDSFLGLDREVSRPPVNNFSRSAEGPLKEAVMGSLISEESSISSPKKACERRAAIDAPHCVAQRLPMHAGAKLEGSLDSQRTEF